MKFVAVLMLVKAVFLFHIYVIPGNSIVLTWKSGGNHVVYRCCKMLS